MTTPQILAGVKDVTRRIGWLHLKRGELLQAIEKGQGLKAGEKVRRLRVIRVRDFSQERLGVLLHFRAYARREVRREGFISLTPEEFVQMFCAGHRGCTEDTIVTRIEFEYVT